MSSTTPRIELRPIGAAEAAQVSAYCYPPPYDGYNVAPENMADNVRYLLAPANQIYAVYGDGTLIGFCSFGADAQVPGGDYTTPALDLGIGLDPALTGQGLGRPVVEAMFALALETFAPPAFRTTIAAFNKRSLRLCRRLGFQKTARFQRAADGLEFVILLRPAGEAQPL
jgi:RimJ/RimL family protein N-acetyltransferase